MREIYLSFVDFIRHFLVVAFVAFLDYRAALTPKKSHDMSLPQFLTVLFEAWSPCQNERAKDMESSLLIPRPLSRDTS